MTKEQRSYAAKCAAMLTSDIDLSAEAKRKLSKAIDDLIQELDDYDTTFELQWKRMGEATERWRAEDPANRGHIMPDLGRLLEWLMQQADNSAADKRRMDALEKFLKAGAQHMDHVVIEQRHEDEDYPPNPTISACTPAYKPLKPFDGVAARTLREAADELQNLSRPGQTES